MRAGWTAAALLGSVALHGVAAWGILQVKPVPPAAPVVERSVPIEVVDKENGGVKAGAGKPMGRRSSFDTLASQTTQDERSRFKPLALRSPHGGRSEGRADVPRAPTQTSTPTSTSTSTSTSTFALAATSASVGPGRGVRGAAASPGGGVPPGSGSAAGPVSPGGEGGGLDLSPFLERLRQSAASCAPRRRSHEGMATAQVRFCVGTTGAPTSVALLESTGSGELDRAALDCVIPNAAPFPSIDRCLVVPLRFQ